MSLQITHQLEDIPFGMRCGASQPPLDCFPPHALVPFFGCLVNSVVISVQDF